MSGINRRNLFGGAAAASALTLLPKNVQKALAQSPNRTGSLKDIEHIVLLMQENRSFDHYFGTLRGVRGFADKHAQQLSTGKSVFYQPDAVNPDGYLLPFRLDTHATNAQAIPSTSHAWQVQHDSLNNGKMDSWLPAHRAADGKNGPFVMGYHTRADIPFQYALADAFTICDEYFCSVLGPTWPNRMMWMTGTIDADGKNGGPIIKNVTHPGGYTWTTYAERLEAAGVTWKVYQESDNYGCNMLENFANFQNAPTSSNLYKNGLVHGSEGQFEYDARNDKLPAVSWIIPTGPQSEHPDYLPADGAAFVASKIDAIAANPDVWAKTLFVLNYDENDGIFDHVVPPIPPAGTAGEFIDGLHIGGGFRVPCVLVSPWTAGGLVSSTKFDHTSVLRLLESFTGVKEPNISNWRRDTFHDLSKAIHFNRPTAQPPVLPDTYGPAILAKYEAANLPAPDITGTNQHFPMQEPGGRPSV
jgi:phospholipase C